MKKSKPFIGWCPKDEEGRLWFGWTREHKKSVEEDLDADYVRAWGKKLGIVRVRIEEVKPK